MVKALQSFRLPHVQTNGKLCGAMELNDFAIIIYYSIPAEFLYDCFHVGKKFIMKMIVIIYSVLFFLISGE